MDEIVASDLDAEVSALQPHSVFIMAISSKDGDRAQLLCLKLASLDPWLLNRHRSALLLRNVQWLIADQHVADPLLSILQEAICLNTCDSIAAAAARIVGCNGA